MVRRRARACPASTAAPASAAQAGLTPAADATTNPASVRPTTATVNTGILASPLRVSGRACGPVPRSEAKNRPNTAYSTPMAASHGSAISAAKCPNASPLAANASRLVKFDTGSSSDAELARCVQAYTCGRARTSSRAAVANTTGVSRTTVVSRLSTAVVTAAVTNTRASSRRGRPAADRAIHAPQARNSPSSSHRRARTKMATRKAITGPSRLATAPASLTPIAPAATRMTAAGPAAIASGQPRGLITAQASTASRASKETVSAMAALSGPSLQPALMYPYRAMANSGESIGIDDGFRRGNPSAVTEERAQAERFAELFEAVYLTFHRRDGPRSQLAGASRAVLEHLALAGPLTVGEAAAHMDRAQSVISEIVTHLERRGLLEREDDPADRRRTLIWLTPAGHEALRRDREVLGVDHLARTMARLPPGRADDLIAGLRTLVDLAANLKDPGGGMT